MKAIIFDRLPGAIISRPPVLDLVPDSAVTISGMPVFLPAISATWEARIGVAYRIGRLGKGISRKFADRYVDGVTVAAKAVPVDLNRVLRAEGVCSAVTSMFDGALTPGKWLPYDPQADTVKVTAGDIAVELTRDMLRLPEAIEAASEFITLKTGDIIIPALCRPAFPVTPGDIIEASCDTTPVLRLKIK